MKVRLIEYIDTNQLFKFNCSMCNAQNIEPKWSINFPWKIYCSEYCRERYNIIKVEGYPIVSESDLSFWSSIYGISKQAQRLNTKKTGSKVGSKQAQKSGSTPPYIGVEPLSREPIFNDELLSLFLKSNKKEVQK